METRFRNGGHTMKLWKLISICILCGAIGGFAGNMDVVLATAAYFYDGVHVPDDNFYQFGGANDAATPDFQLGYDEATSDRLEWSDGTNDFLRLTDDGTTGTFALINTLGVGVDDTTVGNIAAYGPSGAATGGAVRIYESADTDTEVNAFRWLTNSSGVMLFGTEGGTDGSRTLFQFTPSSDTIEHLSASGVLLTSFRQVTAAAASGTEVLSIDNDDATEPFIDFRGTAGADTTSTISTLNTSGATTDHLQIEINGTKAWIAISTNNPS